jgi:hypothetical protein
MARREQIEMILPNTVPASGPGRPGGEGGRDRLTRKGPGIGNQGLPHSHSQGRDTGWDTRGKSQDGLRFLRPIMERPRVSSIPGPPTSVEATEVLVFRGSPQWSSIRQD